MYIKLSDENDLSCSERMKDWTDEQLIGFIKTPWTSEDVVSDYYDKVLEFCNVQGSIEEWEKFQDDIIKNLKLKSRKELETFIEENACKEFIINDEESKTNPSVE